MEETRVIKNTWDLSTYRFKIETTGLDLLTDALKDGKYCGIKCPECGTVYMPGATYCRKCLIDIDEVVDVGDEGVINSYVVELADIRGNPIDNPKITVMVKMDGSDSWINGRLRNIDWKDVKVGMRVKSVWAENRTGRLSDMDHFEIIE